MTQTCTDDKIDALSAKLDRLSHHVDEVARHLAHELDMVEIRLGHRLHLVDIRLDSISSSCARIETRGRR